MDDVYKLYMREIAFAIEYCTCNVVINSKMMCSLPRISGLEVHFFVGSEEDSLFADEFMASRTSSVVGLASSQSLSEESENSFLS